MPGLPAEHQVKKRAALCKATPNHVSRLLLVGRLPTMAISMLEKCNPCKG